MNTSKILTKVVDYGVLQPLGKISSLKTVDRVCQKYRNDNVKFITGLGLASIILKDGLGCYMYVKQSLNNEKIPEDKRKFVAALDLANGGLMIALQMITFFTISRDAVQKKIFNKIFESLFNRASGKGYQELLDSKGKEFGKVFSDFHNKSIKTFGSITSLVAAAVIAKRIFVPFIATPLAEKTKAYLYGKEGKGNKTENFTGTKDTNNNVAKNDASKKTNLIEKFRDKM